MLLLSKSFYGVWTETLSIHESLASLDAKSSARSTPVSIIVAVDTPLIQYTPANSSGRPFGALSRSIDGKRILGTFHSLAFYNFSYQSLSNDAGVLVGFPAELVEEKR